MLLIDLRLYSNSKVLPEGWTVAKTSEGPKEILKTQ